MSGRSGWAIRRIRAAVNPRSSSSNRSPGGARRCTDRLRRLAVHLPDQIAAATPALDPAIVAALQRELPSPDETAIDARDLRAFARGQRLLLDSRGAVARLLARPDCASNLSDRERRVLDAALASPQDARSLSAATRTDGRREAITKLRRLTLKLLDNAHD